MEKSTNKEEVRKLNAVLQITKSIIATLNYEEVLQLISDGMSELLDIETAAIYLLEKDDNLYLGATTPALPPDFPDSLRIAHITDHPNILSASVTKQAVVIEDFKMAELSPAERQVAEMRNLKSLLFLPFVHDEMTLGVLILGTCNEPKVYSQEDIDFGQTIANQLAIAIENTRLHADIIHHKEHLEQLVQEKTEDLDDALKELQLLNQELQLKNRELEKTLQYLKETEAQLIQSEKMASLGVLTAGVAHEINNPLNYIMGASLGLENYFKKHKSPDNGKLQTLLNALRVGIDNASKIVKSLNQFSREAKDDIEECDLNLILDNCILMLGNQLKNHAVLHKNYGNLQAIVKGNSGKIHQVFLNIILNASQAVEDGGNIHLNLYIQDNYYVVEVSDDGAGINKENLSKIADPFFTTKAPGMGTGLGLYIAYSIVSEHKGKIVINSEEGAGTQVNVYLPNS